MTFLTDEEIEKKKQIYPEWELNGIPLAHPCSQCAARHMRIRFTGKDRFKVICEHCGYVAGTPRE